MAEMGRGVKCVAYRLMPSDCPSLAEPARLMASRLGALQMNFIIERLINTGRRYRGVCCCMMAFLALLTNHASAECRVSAKDFAKAPMNVGIGIAQEYPEFDEALNAEIALLNEGQKLYQLDRFKLAGGSSSNLLWARQKFDVIVVFDKELMDGAVPKYNNALFTYRNVDISGNTMFADYMFNAQQKIASGFMQIKPSNPAIDNMLLEVGLSALSAVSYMQDPEFRAYYAAINRAIGTPLSDEQLNILMAMRERVILGCLLRK